MLIMFFISLIVISYNDGGMRILSGLKYIIMCSIWRMYW